MKTKLIIAGLATLLAVGCNKPAPPIPPPPTAAESFKTMEDNAANSFDDPVGRFVPLNTQTEVAMLDTKLGNVFYYDFTTKKWVKITSPLASADFQSPDVFDFVPTRSQNHGFRAPPGDLVK